jgi:signal transduction histidine kinase
MLGRAGGDGQLLLYRTVVVGEQGYRQGLLLDWRELGRWLEREVLHPNGLGRVAQVSFSGPGSSSADPPAIPNQLERDSGRGGAYVFPHRFGEPFDTLGAILTLEPLPGVGSTTPIYLLAGLLALAAAAGLAAVYRMVSVVVHFAERRNNFVAAVSHELKTPLTSIRMYGEMLRDGLVSSETKRGEYYRTITDESERLSRLINNVLEFSRLEKGQQDLHVARGSLAALLKEVVEQLRPHAEHEGFGLDLDLEPALPALGFDRDAVIQVIFNLVDNSLKYARNAERKQIELVCRRRGDRVFLSLRDYGPGVPRRHLSRVFEAFYRGEDELTRTTKGTGIGLALVKELVESMGASISAANLDPSEGGGFAVQIAFPVERTQSAESTKSGVG